jgi:hypothetical protein
MSGTGKVLANQNRQKKILEPEIKGEVRKSDNVTAVIFGSPGDDSRPLPDDAFCFVKNENIGGKSAVGFLDTKNAPVAADGERRLYSRDSGGVIKAIIYLKENGTVEVNNGSDFAVRFSALETAFNDLKADYNTHKHSGIEPGAGVSGITDTLNDADISLAKIDDIKVP